MRVGIGVSEDLRLADQAELARAVEAAGLASLWTNEARGRDALLVCQAWAAATERLHVGIGVVPIWTRTPVQLAMAAATLQEASGGRFLLGLGVSHPGTMDPWHGAGYRQPLTAVGDVLTILEQVMTGDATDHDGEVFSSRRFTLQLSDLPTRPRTYLAAMGPRMLALGGQRADGVVLNWSCPDEVVRAADHVRSAAQGRAVEVAAYVRIAVHGDRETARRALARELGRYCALPAYAQHLTRQGFGATVEAVRSAYRDGGSEAVPDAIDDEVLFELGWFGTPQDDPGEMLSTFEAAGLDHLVARVVVAGDDPVSSVKSVLAPLGN